MRSSSTQSERRTFMLTRLALALAAALLLAACAAQTPPPTITPAPTLDTTALAADIQAQIFATLDAQPSATLPPSVTPAPTLDTTALAADIRAQVFATLDAQPSATPPPSITPAPTLNAEALAADVRVQVFGTLNARPSATPPPSVTPASTLDADALVSTVQARVIAVFTAEAEQARAARAAEAAAQQATQTAVALLPVDVSQDDDPAKGPADAKVVIIEFSDFTCPHCARFARETLPLLLDAYGDRVRFVFRDAPILGQMSVIAALAAECADDQGKFWEYHDRLFANQQGLSGQRLFEFVQELEMDAAAFETCMNDQARLAELVKDYEDAQAAGLTGTPLFFINGRRVVGAQPLEVFVSIIEEELAKQGQ